MQGQVAFKQLVESRVALNTLLQPAKQVSVEQESKNVLVVLSIFAHQQPVKFVACPEAISSAIVSALFDCSSTVREKECWLISYRCRDMPRTAVKTTAAVSRSRVNSWPRVFCLACFLFVVISAVSVFY